MDSPELIIDSTNLFPNLLDDDQEFPYDYNYSF